uniref:Uncharacterized protein n=1 Tax=Anopheles culicifacies TaxID=139723 RepID=A0A182MGE0_9DIPT
MSVCHGRGLFWGCTASLRVPIDNEKVPVRIVIPNVTGVQPTVGIDHTFASDVTFHDQRSFEAKFTVLIGTKGTSRIRVDHFTRLPGTHLTDATRFECVSIVECDRLGSFAHPVALSDAYVR